MIARPAAPHLPENAPRAATAIRIALLGPYASRNLGDTATQMAAIQNLRRCRPDVEIVGISPDPKDTLASLGISAFPLDGTGSASGALESEFTAVRPAHLPPVGWLRTLRRCNSFAKSLALLVISGGGQLDDFWGGPWGHPRLMLQWSALARRHGVPVAFACVGLDRLSTRLSRRFAVAALNMAAHVSFRDAQTQQAMAAMGLRRASVVRPDLAFSLRLDPPVAEPPRRFAVINPIARTTWSHAADPRHEEYLRQLADGAQWLAAQQLELRIVCSQQKMDGADALRLKQMLTERGVERVQICEATRVQDYAAHVRGAEIVVAGRLHGAILSLVAGSPVVALAPQPKVLQLMKEVGFPDLCLPLQGFRTDQLIELSRHVLANVGQIRSGIAELNRQSRSQVDATFDELVSLTG